MTSKEMMLAILLKGFDVRKTWFLDDQRYFVFKLEAKERCFGGRLLSLDYKILHSELLLLADRTGVMSIVEEKQMCRLYDTIMEDVPHEQD